MLRPKYPDLSWLTYPETVTSISKIQGSEPVEVGGKIYVRGFTETPNFIAQNAEGEMQVGCNLSLTSDLNHFIGSWSNYKTLMKNQKDPKFIYVVPKGQREPLAEKLHQMYDGSLPAGVEIMEASISLEELSQITNTFLDAVGITGTEERQPLPASAFRPAPASRRIVEPESAYPANVDKLFYPEGSNGITAIINALSSTQPDWDALEIAYRKAKVRNDPHMIGYAGIFFELHMAQVIKRLMATESNITYAPTVRIKEEPFFFSTINAGTQVGGSVLIYKHDEANYRQINQEGDFDQLLIVGPVLVPIETKVSMGSDKMGRRFLAKSYLEKYMTYLKEYQRQHNLLGRQPPIERVACLLLTPEDQDQALQSAQNRHYFEKAGGIVIAAPFDYAKFADKAGSIGLRIFREQQQQS